MRSALFATFIACMLVCGCTTFRQGIPLSEQNVTNSLLCKDLGPHGNVPKGITDVFTMEDFVNLYVAFAWPASSGVHAGVKHLEFKWYRNNAPYRTVPLTSEFPRSPWTARANIHACEIGPGRHAVEMTMGGIRVLRKEFTVLATGASSPQTQPSGGNAASFSLPPRTFPIRNIAVANLDALGVAPLEALTLSESLRVTLVDSKYFNVVTRSDMGRILEEQDFQQAACSDTQCLVDMGKILSVEKIVGGTVGRVGDTFSVAVRMIDVESGRIDHSVLKSVSGREDRLLDAIALLGKELALKYAASKSE